VIFRNFLLIAAVCGLMTACTGGKTDWDIEKDGSGLWYQPEQDRLFYLEKLGTGPQAEYQASLHAASPRVDRSSVLYFRKSADGGYICLDDNRLKLAIAGKHLILDGFGLNGTFSETWIGLPREYLSRQLAHYQPQYAAVLAKPATTLAEINQRVNLFILVHFLQSIRLPAP